MPGGECVAIIPRSWMNGDYFKDFRKWLTNECSIDTIAIYGSRQEHFKDMKILQEIMLLKLSKRQQTESIRIYNDVSPYAALKSQTSDMVLFKDLVLGRTRTDSIVQKIVTLYTIHNVLRVHNVLKCSSSLAIAYMLRCRSFTESRPIQSQPGGCRQNAAWYLPQADWLKWIHDWKAAYQGRRLAGAQA